MSSLTATADQTFGGIRILADDTVLLDTYSRSVTGGFGSAMTGQAYSTAGGSASDYNVNGSVGTILLGSVNVSRQVSVGAGLSDCDAVITVTVPAVATGAPLDIGLQIRKIDTSNYYMAELQFRTDSSIVLRFTKNVAASFTTGFASVTIPDTYGVASSFRLRARVIGSNLFAKVWSTSVGEPTGWTLTTTDAALTGSGGVGIRAIAETSNTNTSPTFQVDNLLVPGDDNLSLFRITPDGVSTLVRGSPVITSANQVLFLDDEAPLNTVVTYSATSIVSTFTSNSVSVTGTGGDIGWIKDPTVPALDVPINFTNRTRPDCVGQMGVTFSDIEVDAFNTANGEFEIINTANPNVITMSRKSLATVVHLISQALSDSASLEALFATGRIILLQLPTAYGWGYATYGSGYVNVHDVSRQRMPSQDKRHPQREYVLPVRICNPPAAVMGLTGSNGIGLGRSTYGTMKVTGATYATLKATLDTYVQLAQGLGY